MTVARSARSVGRRSTRGGASIPGTWTIRSALVHLPSGLRVHVCAYSDRAGAFTRFPAGAPCAARTADPGRRSGRSRGDARGDGARPAVRADRGRYRPGALVDAAHRRVGAALLGGGGAGAGGVRGRRGSRARVVERIRDRPALVGGRLRAPRMRARGTPAAPRHVPSGPCGPGERVRDPRVLVSRIAGSRGSAARAALQPGGNARELRCRRRRARTRSIPRRSSVARGPHSNPCSPGRLPDRATNGGFRAGSPKRRRRGNRSWRVDRTIRGLREGERIRHPGTRPSRRPHRRRRTLDAPPSSHQRPRRRPLARLCTPAGTTARSTRSATSSAGTPSTIP